MGRPVFEHLHAISLNLHKKRDTSPLRTEGGIWQQRVKSNSNKKKRRVSRGKVIMSPNFPDCGCAPDVARLQLCCFDGKIWWWWWWWHFNSQTEKAQSCSGVHYRCIRNNWAKNPTNGRQKFGLQLLGLGLVLDLCIVIFDAQLIVAQLVCRPCSSPADISPMTGDQKIT